MPDPDPRGEGVPGSEASPPGQSSPGATSPDAPAAVRLRRDVASQARRMDRARREGKRTVWFSLGMMGMVGWSIALPTLIGVALGAWVDHAWPSRISWTLTLLLAGAGVGCLNAWRWVRQESERD